MIVNALVVYSWNCSPLRCTADLHVAQIGSLRMFWHILRHRFKKLQFMADPGFPQSGRRQLFCCCQYFAEISKKLHEIEKIWHVEGHAPWVLPPYPSPGGQSEKRWPPLFPPVDGFKLI